MRWKQSTSFKPTVAEFVDAPDDVDTGADWRPIDYVQMYLEKELFSLLPHCTNVRMKACTKKWTIRTMMHFFELVVVNSWSLYRRDKKVLKVSRKDIWQHQMILTLMMQCTVMEEPLQRNSYIQ